MIPALQQYPRFEKGSPSTEYQQIINFCVNYLEGMLVGLIYMDIPTELEHQPEDIKSLQQQLISRERTVRHAFQFQLEKYFSDFKSTSRTRIRVNYDSHHLNTVFSDHKASRIQDLIETISGKHHNRHKNQLSNTTRRLKKLVHRSDVNNDDNPISPLNLGRAFLASIEALNFSTLNNRSLFLLFDHTLGDQLGNFYNQIDLGLYYLDILVELTDPSLFLQPETEEVNAELSKDDGHKSTKPETAESVIEEKFIETVSIEETPSAQNESELSNKSVISLQSHLQKIRQLQLDIESILLEFKSSTENGTVEFVSLFSQLSDKLSPLVGKKQRGDIQKFSHYFTSLLGNSLLSSVLKMELSRLSSPLLEMVLIDPFFFRSSAHPVNDFLLSIVDFELRFKHQGDSLTKLSLSVDELLSISKPTLSDYLPLIESYENFKSMEIIRLERIKEEDIQQKEILKQEILSLTNDITAELVVDQETMQFFYDDWQLLLLHLAQKLGTVSAEFKNSVNIAKMLSWFLDQNKTGSHPRFESTSFKSLLTSIEIGLVTVNFSSEHRHRIRKQLVKEYKQANETQVFSVIPSPQMKISPNKLKLAHGVAHDDSQNNENIAIQFAKNLRMGDWVEIKTSKKTNFTRAKLKWKAADFSLYIFIDRRGHRIKECDLIELGSEFTNGNVKLLNPPSFRQHVYF